MKSTFRAGALSAFVAMFPAAFVLALVWKFPIPLAGNMSGLEAAQITPYAVAMYGVFGGFLLVPFLGGLGGLLAFHLADGDVRKARVPSILYGVLCAFVAGIVLVLWEDIVGPW